MPPLFPTGHHGGSGADYLRRFHPGAPRPWLDLSTGINPFPYPVGTIGTAAWTALPSPEAEHACRMAMAAYLGTAPDALALLPGSQAGIALVPRLFARGDVDIVEPTYNEHARAWRDAGHDVRGISVEEMAGSTAAVLVVVNPNNPDGRVYSAEALLVLARHRSAAGRWLVVDEAFADLTPEHAVASDARALNLIVLRSFGKFFGLAGVRLGAVAAPPSVVARLERLIGPWAVSGPALEIGARAYADTVWHEMARRALGQRARQMRELLAAARLQLLGGTDLFHLTGHDQAPIIFERLANAGIYVRRFRRNPRWLRFGLPPDEMAQVRLAEALAP
ncbi:threonine-phosphate decarboxylase CobD [Iodidimonas sp. SYSU 1G8]|uniref:threonine-phosphate decarboxylase CobD n=1 Tax=Iodidimonas sp. SYSU 1G8 TaxID=3133967 RepID=UPI0031FE904A